MERKSKVLGNNKLNKDKLIKLTNLYEQQLQLLELLLSDINNVTIDTIQSWLDDTLNQSKEIKILNKNTFDEEHYKYLNLFD